MNVIAQRAMRPVEELDDAKALIHRVEQKTVALLRLCQGVMGFPATDTEALFKGGVFLLQSG
ncbi:hypothetical protein A259_16333 [Pseudomonas syringae pv. actinidiae ICMP 19070]|nr:hypothetical protein A259_16333 [Pseudomonas syringae pv. actinidiae ICMP 19070]